jgi:prophage regulatory protein
MNTLPEEGFLRLRQIIGDKTNPAIIPISRSNFLAGVREGRFPKPIKLGKRTTAWKVADIRMLINGDGGHEQEGHKR